MKKEEIEIKKEEKGAIVKSEESLEKYAVAAVIASIMTGKKYKIRNIFLEKNKSGASAWKISGRNYNMQRRDRV